MSSLGTSSYTTSCATATCQTTHLCSSVETTTTTTFTTKEPQRTAHCKPKSCPACTDDKRSTPNDKTQPRDALAPRYIPEDIIVQDFITDPETWPMGEWNWWENMRRVAKHYGPGYHETSVVHADSSSSFEEFGDHPMGSGAGPVWGCAMVVAFSPNGMFSSHLWEIPNFAIPPEERNMYFYGEGNNEAYYFRQNIDYFLQHGSSRQAWQDQFPGLGPLLKDGRPLSPKNAQFFRAIVFIPIKVTGGMWYRQENQAIIRILAEKLNIDKKYITIYGYKPREWLNDDYRADEGRTPPREYRLADPWEGLFSWLYTPRGISGQKELVVRFQKDIIHRDAWCGDGRVSPEPEDGPSNPSTIMSRADEGSCPPFMACGVHCPGSTCTNTRRPVPDDGSKELQVRKVPSNGPTKAEHDLSQTDKIIDPKDAAQGEVWWWKRMAEIVEDLGPGLGGRKEDYSQWSTSVMTTFDKEKDGSDTNRARFGGAGPVWGCTLVIVASPEGVWTSHIWEVPTHSKGGDCPDLELREAFETLNPKTVEEYFQADFLDFLKTGNTLGNYKQRSENKFPGRNPGLDYSFMPNGAFNAEEKQFVWVGIITRSWKDLHAPRVRYGDQIKRVYDRFLEWGVTERMITVKAYPARLEFHYDRPTGKPRPEHGLLSWQYHPDHDAGTHRERRLRVMFEKEVIFEQGWCGSGKKIKLPEDDPDKTQFGRRQEDLEACKLAVSSAKSDSATTTKTLLPSATQACTKNEECGVLSCPAHRYSICHHGLCHCVIKERKVSTTASANFSSAATPNHSRSRATSTSSNSSSNASILTPSTSSSGASTPRNSHITKSSASSSMATLSLSSLTSLEAALTRTLSTSKPEKSSGAACGTPDDCLLLTCPATKYPDCRVPKGGSKLGCYCSDKPKELDTCAKASDCKRVSCDANHTPVCRPLVDFEGATPVCVCDPDTVSNGAPCLADFHCDGLSCDSGKRGLCKSWACTCGKTLEEGVKCSAHEECANIRCPEAKPHKACTEDNDTCRCVAEQPAPRRERNGLPCKEKKDCEGLVGCEQAQEEACENSVCTCKASKCNKHSDCAKAKACEGQGESANLVCEAGECVCKTCSAEYKVLGCKGDGDCNHCCAKGKVPKCLESCDGFQCLEECQCSKV